MGRKVVLEISSFSSFDLAESYSIDSCSECQHGCRRYYLSRRPDKPILHVRDKKARKHLILSESKKLSRGSKKEKKEKGKRAEPRFTPKSEKFPWLDVQQTEKAAKKEKKAKRDSKGSKASKASKSEARKAAKSEARKAARAVAKKEAAKVAKEVVKEETKPGQTLDVQVIDLDDKQRHHHKKN